MKAINGAVLGLAVFAAAYCVCMHVDAWALKYYVTLGEFHFAAPAPGLVRVKFATVAATSAAVGLVGLAVGWLLPRRWTAGVHVVGWVALVAATAAMIWKESTWFN